MKKKLGYCLIILFVLLGYSAKQYFDVWSAEEYEQKQIRQLYQQYEDRAEKQDMSNPKKILKEVSGQIKTPQDVTYVTKETESVPDADCILYIEEIDLVKIIYNGTNRMKHLSQYELVTATDDMHYANGGNYIICGHDSKLYGHSLNRLKEVKKGTQIQIQTQQGTVSYIVDQVGFEKMTDTDIYCKQSDKEEITIISCARYISREHYMIVHGCKCE